MVVPLYLISGILINRFGRRRQGMYMVPNYTTWSTVPFLIVVVYYMHYRVYYFCNINKALYCIGKYFCMDSIGAWSCSIFPYWGTPMHLFHITCVTMPTKQVALLCIEWIIFINDISVIGCQIQMPWTYLFFFPLSFRVNFNDISVVGSLHAVLLRLK